MPATALRIAATALLLIVAACETPSAAPTAPAAPADPLIVGADRDAHGCIGSAGYRWCERTAQCERPWELAARAGYEPGAENTERYCAPAR